MEVKRLIREYVRMVLESAPSKLKVREPYLSSDSTGYENDHLNRAPTDDLKQKELEDDDLAPHLRDQLADDEFQVYGPVPPTNNDPLSIPDPFVRGQYDNVNFGR